MFRIIDEFGNEEALAECTPKGFRKLRPFAPRYRPVAFERLNNPDAGLGGSEVTVAVVGGVLFGPIGAAIGAAAQDNRSKVWFRVATADGQECLCA